MAVIGWDKFYGWFTGRMGVGTRNSGKQNAAIGATFSKAGVPVNTATALAVSAVFSAVSRYAETISCMALTLRELDDEQKPIATNRTHDLARLFGHKPNRYQTTAQWLQVVVAQLRLHNRAYCQLQFADPKKPGSRLVGLLPLMSDQMQVVQEKNGTLTYEYTVDGAVRIFTEAEVLHIRVMGNGIEGDSPLTAAGENLGLAIAARDRASTFAKNGFKPSAVLTSTDILDDEQREGIKARFKEIVETGNDGLHVLEAGLTYQALNLSPADAQLLQSREFETREIARFFNVPLALIGENGASPWGTDFESVMESFYRLCLQPFCELIEAELTTKLLKPEERGKLRFQFNADDLLKLTPGKLHTTVKEQVQGGLITPNEGRAKLGLAPSDDPAANFLYMQQQMVRLGTGGGVATPQNGASNNGA